jgi:hypothetical protein
MPSKRGVGENLIAAALYSGAGWLIHHYGRLATGWTVLALVALFCITGLALIRRDRRPAAQEAARLTLDDLVREDGERTRATKGFPPSAQGDTYNQHNVHGTNIGKVEHLNLGGPEPTGTCSLVSKNDPVGEEFITTFRLDLKDSYALPGFGFACSAPSLVKVDCVQPGGGVLASLVDNEPTKGRFEIVVQPPVPAALLFRVRTSKPEHHLTPEWGYVEPEQSRVALRHQVADVQHAFDSHKQHEEDRKQLDALLPELEVINSDWQELVRDLAGKAHEVLIGGEPDERDLTVARRTLLELMERSARVAQTHHLFTSHQDDFGLSDGDVIGSFGQMHEIAKPRAAASQQMVSNTRTFLL